MTETNVPEEMPSAYEPAAVEARWYPLWERSGCFQPAANGKKPYCIVIPPPNVTGSLHIGHALNNTLQDTLVRYHRMRGYDVLWQPGTDHAGIATQMVVERMLDKEGTSRHALGRDAFLKRVWTWKEESGSTITRQLRRLGASPDWSRERFTMDEGLSRAVRKVFVELYKQKLIYRDKRLVNWDPKLHTAISDLEVEQRETKGHLWHFRYPIEGKPGTFITVATTRPETMLGDSAVAVHPTDERYAALVGKHCILPLVGRRIPIVADEYSDPEKGTGAVKITPAHDFNDFEVGRRHNLPLFNIFDADAKLNDTVPEPYRGLDRFEARKRIVADLEALGLLDQIVAHPHMVPHGDRSGVVIEPWLTNQWYVDAATLAKPAVAAVESGRTEFVPEHWDKTFFEWMKNIQPWCISRQLWWGHQIPVWYGPDGTMFCEETDEAVHAAAKQHYGRDVELTRDADVLDTWFSSALWPFSTLGWPDATPELARFYPTSVLVTSFDIIFFWVARMMMMGLHFMHEVPFRHVYIHALVRDEHGQKMSKSKGNIVDPLSVIDEHGCDALRFTLIALAMQGRDIKLSVDRIAGYRAFANKIWNASRFALMRLEGVTPPPLAEVTAQLEDADRFILSRLATTVGEVNTALGEYRFAEAAASMYAFFWNEFCDWYIELVKPRLLGEGSPGRTAAAATLVHVLDQALRLLHPMMPFITEEIWHKLPIARPTEFIATAPYPTDTTTWANPAVEAAYALMQSAIVAIRGVRADYGIGFAKPLEVTMIVPGAAERATLEKVAPEIIAMAKVGELKIVAAAEKPLGSAVKVLEKVEVVVSLRGLVDFEQEATRLEKQVAKTEAERERIVKKLANEKFVANAPADVVATDRARVQELDGMLASLRQAVAQNRAAAKLTPAST